MALCITKKVNRSGYDEATLQGCAIIKRKLDMKTCGGIFGGIFKKIFEYFGFMKLTERRIRGLKHQEKSYKCFDGGGLFLLVTRNGSKLWRYKFRFAGRERLLSIGKHPDVSLMEARRFHQKARALLAQSINPAEQKRLEKYSLHQSSQNTLESLAADWLAVYSKRVVPSRARTMERVLQRHCLPYLGSKTIKSLKMPMLLDWLQKLEGTTGNAMVYLCKTALKMILDFAITRVIIDNNPLEKGKFSNHLLPRKIRHQPAPERPETVGSILRAIDTAPQRYSLQMRLALRLLPLIATRPSEMLQMKWDDVDWKNKEWRFIISKTKTPLIVPFARQAIEILQKLRTITGNEIHVFSAPRSSGKPLGSKGFPTALSNLPGIPPGVIVPHGWRSVLLTLGQEQCGFNPAWIEMQLGHKVCGPLGDTYNRARFLEQRRQMMQQWADYLDELKSDRGISGGTEVTEVSHTARE